MDKYRIYETETFREDLARCPLRDRDRLQRKLTHMIYPALRREPHAGPNIRKLHNWQPETWRFRSGDWRCFFQTDEKDRLVLMTALQRRSERTYRA